MSAVATTRTSGWASVAAWADPRRLFLAAAGLAALWARPWLVTIGPPAFVLALVFAALLGIGLAVPVEPHPIAGRRSSIAIAVLGCVVVVVAHSLVVGRAPVPLATRFVVLDIVAAVAEEAFFRRFLYGWLRPHGAMVAMITTTVLFAVVHVSTYGAWVVPLDLAAGLLFAWQREASGRWSVPLVTHVVANLLVVL